MAIKKKELEIAVVTWDDAVVGSGWEKQGVGHKPHRCTSIGLVVKEDPEHLILAGTWGVSEEVLETNARTTIPTGWIRSRKKLTQPL